MTKYKRIWLCVLIFLLGMVYLIYRLWEGSHFGGLRILGQEDLWQIVEGKECLENPAEAGGILRLNGNDIAYDNASCTYYIPHNIEKDAFGALFSCSLSEYEIYLEESQAWDDLTEAIQEGYLFRVWFVADYTYAVGNMVFTGAPVMAVHCAERVAREYGSGKIELFDPVDEEVNGLSVRCSDTLVKRNPNSETYSIKLMKKTLDEEKKLSLLGIGKNNNWKLYKISDNDRTLMRAMLASEVWNIINAGTRLEREYQFVELVVNNTYEGLYLLAPKWTKIFLYVDNNCLLHQSEEVSKEELATFWESMDKTSLSQYALFLQTTYAFKNAIEDYIVLEQTSKEGESKYLLIPDKLEFAFGGFPDKLNYLSWNDTSHMLLSHMDMGIEEKLWSEEIFPLCSQYWKQLRLGELDTMRFLKRMQGHKDYIVRSGLAKRCVKEDMYGYYYDRLEQYIVDRMEYLDVYFAG